MSGAFAFLPQTRAGLDLGDHRVGVRPTNDRKVDGACGQDVVDASFQVAGRDVRVEAGSRARGVRALVAVSCEGIGWDSVFLCGPGECECCAVQLCFRHLLLVEVAFADDEEMPGGVVAGRGVADEAGIPELVDVSVAVDAQVVGDVDPSLRVLVISLVLSKSSRRVRVVAEHDLGVVNRHAVQGVTRTAGAGRSGAPSVAAQDLPCGCSRRVGDCARTRRGDSEAGESSQVEQPATAEPRSVSAHAGSPRLQAVPSARGFLRRSCRSGSAGSSRHPHP